MIATTASVLQLIYNCFWPWSTSRMGMRGSLNWFDFNCNSSRSRSKLGFKFIIKHESIPTFNSCWLPSASCTCSALDYDCSGCSDTTCTCVDTCGDHTGVARAQVTFTNTAPDPNCSVARFNTASFAS